jgi:site-specific DNA-cytosine methylase
MIKLLIGGSPCTYWSIAQKNNRETVASGLGWELFKNYVIAKDKFKPDFFLYENNKSATKAIKDQIKCELGGNYIEINSALVSAKNRQRFYVHNCGDVQQPEDRGILLKDVLESGCGVSGNQKCYCLTARYGGAVIWNTLERKQREMIAETVRTGNEQQPFYEIKDWEITIKGKKYPIKLEDGIYTIRKLSVKECCRLQTMPDDYCKAVCASQAYKCLGNGWTAEVIIHILNNALKGVTRDEEIVVLSMYDGIGTGRYCLDKMGFTNVKYYAYEIDKYAIQVAKDNYNDIIECGDAFQVRNDDWKIEV